MAAMSFVLVTFLTGLALIVLATLWKWFRNKR